MVSAPDSESGGPGSRPRSLCCVLRQDTALLFTQVYKWVPANVLG